jgi:hypothetical protein
VSLAYVGVSGYGWSGSGAVVDMLSEVEGCATPGFEFSLVKEPGGLLDLECFLVDNWDVIRHDAAIRDFLSYCAVLDRPGQRFGRFGLDLGRQLEVDFMAESEALVARLAEFTYIGATRVFEYPLSPLQAFSARVLRKLGLRASGRPMWVARPGSDRFVAEVQAYLDCLFRQFAARRGIATLVLDQAIPTANIAKGMRYFDQMKLVVVDRDPRDIYVDLIRNKGLIGTNVDDPDKVAKFLRWHRILRADAAASASIDPSRVLRVRFEDVVLEPQATSTRILAFLGLEQRARALGSRFHPQQSARNVGIWRSYPQQAEIAAIAAALVPEEQPCAV